VSPHVFVIEPAAAADARAGSELVIAGAEGRHAARVLRVRPGEGVEAIDGQGRRIRAVVRSAGRDEIVVQVHGVLDEPVPDPAHVVVQGLPKGEHAELAVDQLTQCGADRIVPWAAANSVAQWDGERAIRGRGKWQQAAMAAAKQARRAWIPQVDALASTSEIVAQVRQAALAVVLHEGASEPLMQVAVPTSGTILILVGPEGGLTDQERSQLGQAGAREASLGPAVLRTSLAGAAALAVLGSSRHWPSGPAPGMATTADAMPAVMEGWRA